MGSCKQVGWGGDRPVAGDLVTTLLCACDCCRGRLNRLDVGRFARVSLDELCFQKTPSRFPSHPHLVSLEERYSRKFLRRADAAKSSRALSGTTSSISTCTRLSDSHFKCGWRMCASILLAKSSARAVSSNQSLQYEHVSPLVPAVMASRQTEHFAGCPSGRTRGASLPDGFESDAFIANPKCNERRPPGRKGAHGRSKDAGRWMYLDADSYLQFKNLHVRTGRCWAMHRHRGHLVRTMDELVSSASSRPQFGHRKSTSCVTFGHLSWIAVLDEVRRRSQCQC